MMKRLLLISLAALLCSISLAPLCTAAPLPQPQSVPMIFEQTVFRRVSIRDFTNESVSTQDLSTLLWNAYGVRPDGTRTVPGVNNTHNVIIYVLTTDGAYTYIPENHSLILYKPGDWRATVGYQYPTEDIVLGLCYNTTTANPDEGGMEIGQVCQNIAFTLDALNLGGVVTGGLPPAITPLGIPPSQRGMIIIPIGHPLHPYHFCNLPLWIGNMAKPALHAMNLTTTLLQRREAADFHGNFSLVDLDQILWASYGFSPYLDHSNQDLNYIVRHRTVPSAKAIYPLTIYSVANSETVRYIPSLLKIIGKPADYIGLPILPYRKVISQDNQLGLLANASSQPLLKKSACILVAVLDTSKTQAEGANYTQFWYLEAGAALHNAALEATTIDMPTLHATPLDRDAIATLLHLSSTQVPLALLGVGAYQ